MKRKVKDEDGYEEGHEVGDIVHRHSQEQSIHDDVDNNDAIMNSRVKIEDDSKMTHMGGTTNGQLQLHLSKMIPDRDRGRIKCPYLDTVNRQMIDFDSEKLCSITLTNMNVYVCLVCGKYFQGRGKTTPLFTHSVQAGHFVFMNLQSGRVYCLPDDYEVVDTSLRDVQRCLSPRYSLEEINALNRNTSLARDVHGVSYLPGFVGLNNLNSTDYINSLLHALAHVTPFRDYWLEPVNYELCKSNIVHRFGLTLRKLWSSSNFKSTVSPQELIQEVVVESNKRFVIGQRAECIELMVWMLNTLQRGVLGKAVSSVAAVNKNKKKGPIETSAIYEPFQGIVEVTSLTKKLVDSYDKQLQEGTTTGSSAASSSSSEWVRAVNQTTFSHLSLDIPACPLFRDSEGGLVIPQVPLFEVLRKFDGLTWTDQVTSEAHVRRQYRILQLPRYLILHLVRFTRNNFYLEKNPTIVTFPVKNLEMRDFLFSAEETTTTTTTPENDDGDDVSHMSMSMSIGAMKQREIEKMVAACPQITDLPDMSSDQLIALVEKLGSALHKLQLKSVASTPALAEHRGDLLIIAQSVVERVHLFRNTKYDLLANICHDSTSSAKMVTVGDLNLLLGHSTATKQAKNASLAMANGSISNNNGPEALGQSAAATSSNNRVLNDGAYKVHIQHKATGQWFEVQDLRVTEVTPQFIGVSESNILIYEKKSSLK